MKRRAIPVILSDEDAELLDAVRFAYGDAGLQCLADEIRAWLRGAKDDPMVAKLLRARRRRGFRVVA